MLSVIQKIASIALSGNLTVTVPFADLVNRLELRVSALYAAVAATSGITVQPKISYDGSTYTNFGPLLSVSPAATVVGQISTAIGDVSLVGRVVSVQLVITNTDGTNAVEVVVDTIGHQGAYSG